MKHKALLPVLLASAMLVGCSGDASGSKELTPDALASLIEASGDDTAAQDAWKAIFKNFAESTGNQFMVETDGEDYLFDENNAHTMVEDNFIYEIGKDAVFWDENDTATSVQLTDVDDSYHDLYMGYGNIDRFGQNGVMSSVILNGTKDDKLSGYVKTVETDNLPSVEEGAVEALTNAAMEFGYVRAVSPVTNSSLYLYDLKQDGSDWKLELKIKDLEAFQKKASVGGVLINARNGEPTLVMDDIQDETWTFTFDKDGILKEEENDIYHVINGISEEYSQKYMNLLNRAEFKKAKSEDIKPAAFDDYFAGCLDGSIKKDTRFTIDNWN